MGKISKSRGGGPMSPMEMIERTSADAVRYWASSTSPGKDSVISEEKIQLGVKLVIKLWNVARFSERFLQDAQPFNAADLSPADRWALSRLQKLVRRTTELLEAYEYAAARAEIEAFFWSMADNYLEMAKQRLYDEQAPGNHAARFTLRLLLETLLKLFAPYLPFITEEIYQGLFTGDGDLHQNSIHRSAWPEPNSLLEDDSAEAAGELLVAIATTVRRFKSEHSLPLGSELALLQLAAPRGQAAALQESTADLMSVCRARQVEVVEVLDPTLAALPVEALIGVAVEV